MSWRSQIRPRSRHQGRIYSTSTASLSISGKSEREIVKSSLSYPVSLGRIMSPRMGSPHLEHRSRKAFKENTDFQTKFQESQRTTFNFKHLFSFHCFRNSVKVAMMPVVWVESNLLSERVWVRLRFLLWGLKWSGSDWNRLKSTWDWLEWRVKFAKLLCPNQ